MKRSLILIALALSACATKPAYVLEHRRPTPCEEAADARRFANFMARTGSSAFTREQHKRDVNHAEAVAHEAEMQCLLSR
jgi:hypothetical protein